MAALVAEPARSAVLYKDMDAGDLRSAYQGWRTAAYNWSRMAQMFAPRSTQGRRVAAGWGRANRNVELIEAIARKRGIDLFIKEPTQ